MPLVEIRFWGTAAHPGRRTWSVAVPETAVLQDVLEVVASDLGGDAGANLRDILSFCTFVVNGDSFPGVEGLRKPVQDGDVVAIVPAVGGGSDPWRGPSPRGPKGHKGPHRQREDG